MIKRILSIVIIIFMVQCSALPQLFGEITLDGTLGPAGPVTGPDHMITADLGRQKGHNLFHSFSNFQLYDTESAIFTGPNEIKSIIARVTGGFVSYLDGSLESQIKGAGLYFINPAGIIFGPSFSQDIQGAFHVSTADYLVLGSDGLFHASDPGKSLLTASPVEAFGFLDEPGDIHLLYTGMTGSENQRISLIGGTLNLMNAGLTASGGNIEMISAGSPGNVRPEQGGLDPDTGQQGGSIILTSLTKITGTGKGEEQVYIRGGSLVVDSHSEIHMPVTDDTQKSNIVVEVDDTVELSTGGRINMVTFGQQDAGDIKIRAGDLLINGEGITTGVGAIVMAEASGRGGNIDIETEGELTVINGGQINTSTAGTGSAGSIRILSDQILVDGGPVPASTGIAAQVSPGAAGAGGDIFIDNAKEIKLQNGAQINVSTYDRGDAGNIILKTDDLYMDGMGLGAGLDAAVSNDASGSGGDIRIEASGTIEISDGALINVATYGIGDAGTLEMDVETLKIDGMGNPNGTGIAAEVVPEAMGTGGSLKINASESVLLHNGGTIDLSTSGSGDAGNLTIRAGSIEIDGKANPDATGLLAYVSSSSSSSGGNISLHSEQSLQILNGGQINLSGYGTGKAGDLEITSRSLLIDGRKNPESTGITSHVATGSVSQGGSVSIKVSDTVDIVDGGYINLASFGQGDAGSLDLEAGKIKIDGMENVDVPTGISALIMPGASGNGSDVRLAAQGSLDVLNHGIIDVSTYGNGNAGNLEITAGSFEINGLGRFAGIKAESDAPAQFTGGNIVINVENKMSMINGGFMDISTYGDSSAGSLFLSATDLLLDGNMEDAGIGAQVMDGATGRGGDIKIALDHSLELLNGGRINVSTFGRGNAGNLEISAHDVTIDGQGNPVGTGLAAQVGTQAEGRGGEDYSPCRKPCKPGVRGADQCHHLWSG